jgi:hypothetical protein
LFLVQLRLVTGAGAELRGARLAVGGEKWLYYLKMRFGYLSQK